MVPTQTACLVAIPVPGLTITRCACNQLQMATRNLNKIIDVNYYPVDKARNSNMRHRPIGLGVQVRPQSIPPHTYNVSFTQQTPHAPCPSPQY